MEKTYVIGWRSKSEPRWGQGKRLLTRDEAQALSAEMNRDYPAFVHEPLNLTASEPLESPIVHVDFVTTSRAPEQAGEVVMA